MNLTPQCSKTKNNVPKNTPKGMELNAMGNVTKTRPGPSDAAKPFAKTIGNIAIPANKATPVSMQLQKLLFYRYFDLLAYRLRKP